MPSTGFCFIMQFASYKIKTLYLEMSCYKAIVLVTGMKAECCFDIRVFTVDA